MIKDLRERWLPGGRYAHLIDEIQRMSDYQVDNFWAINDEAIQRLHGVTIYNWREKTSPEMFIGQFDLNEFFTDQASHTPSPDGKTPMLDLRGYNTAFPLVTMCRASNCDLSFCYTTIGRMGGFDFSSLEACYFKECDFTDNTLAHVFNRCKFESCVLTRFQMDCTYLESCVFWKCKMNSPRIFRAHAVDTQFEKCNFRSALFGSGHFERCAFLGCNFEKADLETSWFVDCRFEDCDMSKIAHPPGPHPVPPLFPRGQ